MACDYKVSAKMTETRKSLIPQRLVVPKSGSAGEEWKKLKMKEAKEEIGDA
jgi:hypothetical protein